MQVEPAAVVAEPLPGADHVGGSRGGERGGRRPALEPGEIRGITRSTCVCCSITSLTRIAYGSVVLRQGRSRPFVWYQARSSSSTGASSRAARRHVELGGRETDRGVGGSVVEAQFARLLIVDEPARKDRVRHVAAAFVGLERPEHPVRRATEDSGGLLEIEQRETEPVDRARHCLFHAVVDQQPAVLRLEERRADPDPERVPPGAAPGLQHHLRRAPASEVIGAGERDARVRDPEAARRPVEEDPLSAHPLRQECRVLVLGSDHDSVSLDRDEVLRRSEIDSRSGRTVRRAGDHEAIELLDPDGPRVLEPPLLTLDAFLRREQGRRRDVPTVDSVGRTGRSEVRDPGQRLDPREQDGLAADDRGAGVEDYVDRLRPVGRRQDWISRMATEKLAAAAVTPWLGAGSSRGGGRAAIPPRRARAVRGGRPRSTPRLRSR